jgi:ATP synthase protein I
VEKKEDNKGEKKEETTVFRQLMRASTIGIQLVVCTFVGLAIGVLLDKLFGTRPWLTIIFLFVGIATGFRDLIRMAKEE